MVAESEKFAEEDELIKKRIEARNALENCKSVFGAAKTNR